MATKRAADGRFIPASRGRSERRSSSSDGKGQGPRRPRLPVGTLESHGAVKIPDAGSDRTRRVEVKHRHEGRVERPSHEEAHRPRRPAERLTPAESR
jgi:hypothetical protein